mgnify:CR=1 FL=1
MRAFGLIASWGVQRAAVGVVDRSGLATVDGTPLLHGDARLRPRIASVTKLFTAYVGLIAVEEGSIDLDEPAGPEGATVRHLLSHTAGYGFSGDAVISPPGKRRIYSNTGIERFADHLATRTGIPFGHYLAEAVLEPLGMRDSELRGSPAFGLHSTLADLAQFAAELLEPRLIAHSTLDEAVRVQFPGVSGILPGVGRFDPCDWGLGFERNLGKPSHWSGMRISRESFGHFGGSGSFLAVDPTIGRAIVCLTDREYDKWALEAWPIFCDAVVDELAPAGSR